MGEIPVIDIEGWWSGDTPARRRIAEAFDAAAREHGFLQIVGHGVPAAVRAGIRDAADGFFALDDAAKRLVEPPSREINRGYSARRSESLAYTLGAVRPADLAEAFIVGNDHATNPRGGFDRTILRFFFGSSPALATAVSLSMTCSGACTTTSPATS